MLRCFVLLCFLVLLPQSSVFAAENDVIWGVVGHNSWPHINNAYNKILLRDQVALIKRAGFSAYRAGCDDRTCPALLDLLLRDNLILLRTLEKRPSRDLSEEGNYEMGFAYGKSEAGKFDRRVGYYEISNELDNWSFASGDGSSRSHYDSDKYVKARGFIRGVIDGIKLADSSAQVLVDNAGWCHYGFLRALWEDGVRWDITAFHWYSNQGDIENAGCNNANVAEIHASFGLPVWITEFNFKAPQAGEQKEAAAEWVLSFMRQIQLVAPKYNIQAAFIYELFDESEKNGGEQYYGVLNEYGVPKAVYFSIRDFLESRIQE